MAQVIYVLPQPVLQVHHWREGEERKRFKASPPSNLQLCLYHKKNMWLYIKERERSPMAEKMCINVHECVSVLQTPPISPTHLTHLTLKRNPSTALTFERRYFQI